MCLYSVALDTALTSASTQNERKTAKASMIRAIHLATRVLLLIPSASDSAPSKGENSP